MTALLPGGPLKVTLNGLDARARTRLAMFLQGPAQGICEVVGEAQAEAAIFDLDGYGAERLWQTFRERFHGPAVVMSVGEKHLHNALWVRKPISATDFLAAIELIHQRLKTERRLREIELAAEKAVPATIAVPPSSAPPLFVPQVSAPPASVPAPVKPVPTEEHRPAARPPSDGATAKATRDADGAGRAASLAWNDQQIHASCGTMEDAVYLDLKRRWELYYEPEEYLQGMLQRACLRAKEGSHPVRLDVGGQALIVLAGGRQVFSDTREQRLRPLCVIPTSSRLASLHDLRQDELPKLLRQDPRLHNSETMLWMISLWSSRGRVPRGSDLDAPVSLLSWPCFSRLLIPPHAMQITALWHTRPLSLMQTAKLLAIPHRYVFALYSACLALGLIETAPAATLAAATPSDETTVPAEKRGLLGGLLRKLRLAR
jgi:hypothetical protein